MSENLAALVDANKLSPVQAPQISATHFKLVDIGTDFVLILERAVPMYDEQGSIGAAVAVLQPVATLFLSSGAAKDLSLIISNGIKNHEEAYGSIQTPFSKAL